MLLNLLVRFTILKPRPFYVRHWRKSQNIEMLRFSLERGDYHARSAVASELAKLKHPDQKKLLFSLLADGNQEVVANAVASLNTLALSKQENSWIKSRLFEMAEEEAHFMNTLKDSDFIKVTGAYVDRSQMVRLKAVKAAGNKIRGALGG